MSIRLKLALLFTVLTLALLLGVGAFFLLNLRSGLQDSMDTSLRVEIGDAQAQLGSAPTGDGSFDGSGHLRLANSSYGQVLTSSGQVLQSTDNVLNHPLLTATQAAAAARGQRLFDATIRPNRPAGSTDVDPIRVRIIAQSMGAGSNSVLAIATSREVVDEALDRSERELLVVGAIVLVLAGPGAWLLARAALRPVERMRAQAAELQARDAGGGLSVPPSGDEVARLADTLNALLGRLHSALEHERAFVADAGHELRTPLTVLRGELELARRPGRSVEQLSETVEVAAEETERLIRLAEDLLVLAREGSGLPVQREAIDVAGVVAAARGGAAAIASPRGITVGQSGPDPLPATGDADRIRQAVDNLLANAVRYAPNGGRVDVTLGRVDGHVEVAVIDDGPGFDAQFLPHAFERFRRGDPARRRGAAGAPDASGTGLGLAIVRTIMTAHGGTATATNRLDGPGARVVLRWPDHLDAPLA